MLKNAVRGRTTDNWPRWDIVEIGDDARRISMAVVGRSLDEVNISTKTNLPVVAGENGDGRAATNICIAASPNRSCTRRFELAIM